MRAVLAGGFLLAGLGLCPALVHGEGETVHGEGETGVLEDAVEPQNPASLKGLKSLCISILDIDDEAEANGLQEEQVYFEVTLQLAKAGFNIIPPDRYENSKDSAYLNVFINTLNTDGLSYVYNLGLSLSQEIALLRNPKVAVMGSTWRSEELGIVATASAATLRESIRVKVEEFIRDHKSANTES